MRWHELRFKERFDEIFAKRQRDEITDLEATAQMNEAERELRKARAEEVEVPW